MRISFYTLTLLFFIGCASHKNITISTIKEKQTPESTRKVIAIIASDEMEGRKPGTPGMEKVSNYIEKELSTYKIAPFFKNSYKDSVDVNGVKSYNLVGIIGDRSKNNESILIGAHLDHLGKRTSDQDSIFNGANDNASGVTAVLQIAKFLSAYKFNKNIIVCFFTGEEDGLIGSHSLAKKIKQQNISMQYMLNFEMIGKTLSTGQDKVYITGFSKSNCAEVINTALQKEFIVFLPAEDSYRLFYRSDNFAFFEELNIPAHTLSTFDFQNYNYYHAPEDEVDKLDIENMNSVINASTLAIIRLLQQDLKIVLKK